MTIDEWAKEIGGRFAHILELTLENGELFALVRTNHNWDGITYKVPADVQFEPNRVKGWEKKLVEPAPPSDEALPF